MEEVVDVNATNNNGDTWLIIASRTPLLKNAVPSLLSHYSNNSSNEATSSSGAKLLQDDFVNINQANNDGQTALMVAAGMGHADIVELLISHEGDQKLDANVRDIDNNTALHYAVTSGSLKCVALLLQVPGIEIDNSLESYIRGKEWSGITKMVQDSRATIWKKTKAFENLVFEVCNGDLSKLPEPWEPGHIQVKKSMDLIKSMSCTENEIFHMNNGKIKDVKWLEYPEKIIFNTINSLLTFYQTDLTGLQEKVVSNNPPNLQYFLKTRLVDLMKNPGAAIPTIFKGYGFNAKEILESMTCSERANLINGLVNMSDLSKYPTEIFKKGVNFYIEGLNRALGLPGELSAAEMQSQFSFCKSIKNYQDAYDLNETYWQKISNQNSFNGANSYQLKLLDRDGEELNLVTTFGEYIVKKAEMLCGMGRLEEARDLCSRTLKDMEEKTVHMRNGKVVKLSLNAAKSEIGLVIESLYVCLSTISVQECDFEKAFKILDRNVFEGLELRLDTINNNHNTLKQAMTETNFIAKESLEEDFENCKIIVNPFLENHYIDGKGKIFVESLDKALRIAKNGDSIFLKNGEHYPGLKKEDGKMVTASEIRENVRALKEYVTALEEIVKVLEKNLTIIGESTNNCVLFLFVSFHKRTMAEVQFKRLNVMIFSPIHVSEGKISFESCLVEGGCDYFFMFDKRQAEIDLHLCCFTSHINDSLVQLKNSDSTIKVDIRNCLFSDFTFIIRDSREMSLRCGLELHIVSCSFLGIKVAIIAFDRFTPSQKETLQEMDSKLNKTCSPGVKSMLTENSPDLFPSSQKGSVVTYPTSIAIRNCYVDVCTSTIEDMAHIINIDNVSHVLIESTKFNLKRGDQSDQVKVERINTGLHFANIQRVEIINTIVIREGNHGMLASLQTYLEKLPKEGSLDDSSIQREGNPTTLASLLKYIEKPPKQVWVEDAAIQLRAVHEATIRDSIFKGFYCGITTKSRPIDVNKVDKICFTGVYNCELSHMAVCVLLDSRFTSRSIFALSDISLRDSLVGVRVSEMCCRNGSVDVLDTKFINIASPIMVPKALKKDAKDGKKNLVSRLETKNLTFPDGGPQNISRKKRRDSVITNLMKTGVLDSTASLPYLETVFNPKGDWLEIANENDLEPFNFEQSRPQSTSDYQSDNDDSVD